MHDIEFRKATLADYPELIRLIDGVFFPGNPDGFRQLLPNLYVDPANATRDAYLAFHAGRMVGHVGVYPLRIRAGNGIELPAAGVGAVSAHPEFRGKGIMSSLLAEAIKRMTESAHDISVLWGDRMRYSHFGWEAVGATLEWRFDDRFATAAGFEPVELIPFDPDRHLSALIAAWNSDRAGTVQDVRSMQGLMGRAQWTTSIISDAGDVRAFVTYKRLGDDIYVDKLIGAPEILPRILLALRESQPNKSAKLVVKCPACPHPVAQLAIRMNSSMCLWPTCQTRIINMKSLCEKLRIDSPKTDDLCKAAREIFGTPADLSGHHNPLWIEAIATV